MAAAGVSRFPHLWARVNVSLALVELDTVAQDQWLVNRMPLYKLGECRCVVRVRATQSQHAQVEPEAKIELIEATFPGHFGHLPAGIGE
jgi:hypothetical protein